MRNSFSKIIALSLVGCFVSWGLWRGSSVWANLSGPPLASTGAIARGNFVAEQNCTACHNGLLNGDDGTVALAATPLMYSPNQEVQITLSVEQPERFRFGFQGTAVDDLGRPAGQWVIVDQDRTQIVNETSGPFAGRSYIEHSFNGTEPTATNLSTWMLRWKAPVQNVGRVNFYFAVNAANNNGQNSGDSIYTRTISLTPVATLPTATAVSAASYTLNAPLAPDSIGALFGQNLTNATQVAASLPLPTTLANAQVRVRDASGVERDAQLFFVSPTQINFLVPAQTSLGTATVTARLQGGMVATGTVTIARSASAVFSANADGTGVPAANLLRIKADGTQLYEDVMRLNATTRRFEPLPIDLGVETDQVFLILFGSGFRAGTAPSSTIGGQEAEVLFAGAQGSFAGLDQANIRLARSLAGRGNVNVVFRADNQNANAVTINLK